MNIFSEKRARNTTFALNPVAAGCAVFLSVLAGSVYAQTAPATESTSSTASNAAANVGAADPSAASVVPTVTVTGIRRGIEAAISLKKNSSSIVEAISAEDLGKLPDTSVAESIARLPGVTAQRSRGNGKAADISVRGLAPSFNGSLLNGREQASTGNARSPEFDLFPAELIGSALIYKTSNAALVGQGLASTIDLHTVQPLDFGKRTIAVGYRKETTGVKSGNPEGDGKRFTVSYIDQFLDRTVGVAIGMTRYDETGGGQAKFISEGGNSVDYNGAKVTVPNGFHSDTENSKDNRDGISATLQYRPNRSFKSTVDMFQSKGSSSLKKTGLEGSIAGSWGGYDPVGMLVNPTIVGGVATSGTMTGFKGVVRNHLETADDKLTSIGWNTEYKVADWKLIADLSHSKGRKDSVRYETIAGQPGNTPEAQVGSISWTGFDGKTVANTKLTTSLDYSDRKIAVLTDVDGWGGGPTSPQAGYIASPTVVDKVDAIRLSGHRDLTWGPVSGVEFGVNYTKRDKVRSGQEGRLSIKNGDGYASVAAPGSDVGIAGTTGLNVVKWDPTGSLGSIYNITEWVDSITLAKDWSVSEKVSTAYAMGELDGELVGLSYKGNFGAQFVHTNQQTSGNKVSPTCTGITAATCPSVKQYDGTSYSDFLPSANVNFDLGSEQMLRLGVAKIMARAPLDEMRASSSFGVNRNGTYPILTGSGGNAKLEPYRAKAADLSYEKYFGKKGYVSAAVFYKKLDNYILRTPLNVDFKDQITPGTQLPDSGPFKDSTLGLMTKPINGEGGKLKGIELAVNVPFSIISPYLDGFGMFANYSNTQSGIDLPSSGFSTSGVSTTRIPLPGLSKQVSNLRLYYEKAGFQFAWAARKRSNFLGQISDYQDNAQLTFVKGETIVDLQASYEIQSGMFKGLSVFAQANNWNNTPYQEYNGADSSSISYRTTYGRTYQFGANYKF
jgi:iron complex outermembrane receptor protein